MAHKEDIRTPFGAATEYYRKQKRHLSQGRLAKDLGISQAMISKIESGLSDGKRETQDKILKYFNKTYDGFLKKGRDLLKVNQINILEFEAFLAMLHAHLDDKWINNFEGFAKKAKLSKPYFFKVLQAETVPTKTAAIDIANACGLTYNEFIDEGALLVASEYNDYTDPITGEYSPGPQLNDFEDSEELINKSFNQFRKDYASDIDYITTDHDDPSKKQQPSGKEWTDKQTNTTPSLSHDDISNHNFFLLALLKISKRDWFRKTNLLAKKARVRLRLLNDIYDNKIIAPKHLQKIIAKACGYTYEEFLEIGKQEEKKIRDQMYPDENKGTPTPINEIAEAINEVVQERGEELTPERTRKLIGFVKKILAAEKSEELDQAIEDEINNFNDKDEGIKAYRNLIILEQNDSDLFYEMTSQIRAKAKAILRKQKKG